MFAHRLECERAHWLSSAAASAQPGHVAWTRTRELPGASALSFSLSSVASGSGLERNKREKNANVPGFRHFSASKISDSQDHSLSLSTEVQYNIQCLQCKS